MYATLASDENIKPEVMRDMFETLSGRAEYGTEFGRKTLDEYLNKPSRESLDKLLQNIDEVPMESVLRIMRGDDREAAALVYKRLLRENDNYLRDLAEEGELSREEMNLIRKESSEYQNIVDIMADLFPEGSLVPYLHKFSKDYRFNSIRNWVVKRLTKPVVENSISVRMRPWDVGLQIDIPILNTKEGERLFFLDNGHREKVLYDPVFSGGRKKLGDVWDKLQSSPDAYGPNRKTVEDIIEGLAMRTPMDSVSGAHKLKFGGFTGVDGYSAMLHPKTMKALGGADLDGDKTTIFFGGETNGFKKSWKNMYESARNEYVNKDGSERHNKDEVDPILKESYRRIFAKADAKMEKESQHISSQYTPYWRYFMSKGAFEGRDGLGIAVISKQDILGSYDAIKNAPKKAETLSVPYRDASGAPLLDGKNNPIYGKIRIYKDTYEVPYHDNGSRKIIVFKLKKDSTSLQRFKEMSRAAIALGSDPMDEAGIKTDMFKPYMLDTLFSYKVHNVEKGRRGSLDIKRTRQLNTHKENDGANQFQVLGMKNLGLHSRFNRVNRVLYSRNFKEGRIYTYPEIMEGVESLDFLPTESRSTFIPMLAERVKALNFSDNVFRRVQKDAMLKIYKDYEGFVKKHDYLKEVLGRSSLSTKKGKFLETIFKESLWEEASIKRIASDPEKFSSVVDMVRYDAGLKFPVFPKREYLDFADRIMYERRKRFLEKIVVQGEDYLINDLSDMATLKAVVDVIQKHKIPSEVVERIHHKADSLKTLGAQYAKRRKAIDKAIDKKEFKDKDVERILGGERLSPETDQIRIDRAIKQYKDGLGKDAVGEKKLFDMLYMGTYQRGDAKRLEAIKGIKNKEIQEKIKPVIAALEKAFHNTSLIRAGVISKAIPDSSKREFFREFEKLWKTSQEKFTEKEKAQLEREAESRKEDITEYRTEDGKFTEGQLIDAHKLSETDNYFLDNIGPFKNIWSAKGKVKDPELVRLYSELKEHLDHYHQLDVRNLNGFFRGIFGKDIGDAHKQDLLSLNRILNEMRDGTWWNKMMDWFTGKKNKAPVPKKSNYWKFPKAIDRDLLKSRAMIEFIEDVGPYKDRLKNTVDNARVVRPTSTIGKIQQLAHRVQELSMNKNEEERERFENLLKPYVASQKEGDLLYQTAVAQRELQYMKTQLRGQEKGPEGRLTENQMSYQEKYDLVKNDIKRLKDMEFIIPTEKGRKRMSGEQVWENINRIITETNERIHKFMTGDEAEFGKWLKISEDSDGRVTWGGVRKLRKMFIKKTMDSVRLNKPIEVEKLGIDGMRQIIKRIQLDVAHRAIYNNHKLLARSSTPESVKKHPKNPMKWRISEKELKRIEIQKIDTTGKIDYNFYYPHIAFNRAKSGRSLKAAWRKISEDTQLTKEERAVELKKIFHQYHQLTGDFMSRDDMGTNWKVVQDIATSYAEGRIQRAKSAKRQSLTKVGNQFSREGHMPGWDTTPEGYISYIKNVVNAFHRQAMQAASNVMISDFGRRFNTYSKDSNLTRAWQDFFYLYTQQAMGYPTHIPKRIMDNPLMKIKGTPYKWFADSQVKKRIDWIGKKLGVNRKELEKMNLEESVIDELSGVEYNALQRWSALEAKWQLASLLAHPKSSIANLYGGTVHTWISTGWENLKKARNFEYLQTNINPKWKSMKDVERWLQKLGIIEEFLVYEAGLNPELKNKKWQSFMTDVRAKLRKDPNMADSSLYELAKQHNISRRLFDKAAAFMRIPERILRRDAFMAHYIQAMEQFGGAITDYNSPYLIKMAKQGVKGTQFLYSAPFRPMWTNSALGRVFSRFQLWSWNSVRFRNDVIKRAHEHGFREGTKEFDTLVRLSQADLFMYGLSSIYMYSLFENALPAPWNWFQDTADWFFGDETEKERAFYGSSIGPLQAVTPPSLRLLPPMFKWMMSGDASRLTDYYLWTIPPFGRLIRDVAGPGGAIENPYYAITKFTGLPVLQLTDITDRDDKPLGGKFIYG
jgi:hypothetical protein